MPKLTLLMLGFPFIKIKDIAAEPMPLPGKLVLVFSVIHAYKRRQ